jgi:hypothetical protein
MCENYSDGVVLACWPSGKVQKFPSLAKAKTMLMRHHYMYLICTPPEAYALFCEEEPSWRERWKISEEAVTTEWLWQYLLDIAVEKNPWAKADAIPDSNRMSKRATAEGYIIHRDKAAEFDKAKAPKQAKIIAQSLLLFEDDGKAVRDKDIEALLRQQYLKGVLKTKQDVMRIFSYYRPALLKAGVISLRS